MKKVILFVALIHLTVSAQTQNFINGDLEGEINTFSTLPLNWEAVSYSDPACNASFPGGATPDLTDLLKPSPEQGVFGMPYSGLTFVSGLDAVWLIGDSLMRWHEGIQQNVSGLIPNTNYTINFYQTVVKQISSSQTGAIIDTSGSWSVFLDEILIGVSDPSLSLLPFNSSNLIWDFRSIPFTATSTMHTFKFLPKDDDNISASDTENGRLRMGIDLISLGMSTNQNNVNENYAITAFPNPTTGNISIVLDKEYNNVAVEIFSVAGKKISPVLNFSNQKISLNIDGPTGLYFIQLLTEHSPVPYCIKVMKH